MIGFPETYREGRAAYLDLITREAKEAGLPAAIADAVAQVESGFNPTAVGGVGEVGLMQIRPETAAMLGYRGSVGGLFEPEINVRLGVKYLAQAWRLTDGNLCRTLMKYRAGHGEERMSALSVEYCRRARVHLAALGSPLADGASPQAETVNFTQRKAWSVVSVPAPEAAFQREVRRAQGQAKNGGRTAADSTRFWAAQERRISALKSKLGRAKTRIAYAGLTADGLAPRLVPWSSRGAGKKRVGPAAEHPVSLHKL